MYSLPAITYPVEDSPADCWRESPLLSAMSPGDDSNLNNHSKFRPVWCWVPASPSPPSRAWSHYFLVVKSSRPTTSKCCCPSLGTCTSPRPGYVILVSTWWSLVWSSTSCVRWAPRLTVAMRLKHVIEPKRSSARPQHEPAHKRQEVTVTIDAVLLIVMGVMFAAAIYLLMDRTLTRIMFGLMLFTN